MKLQLLLIGNWLLYAGNVSAENQYVGTTIEPRHLPSGCQSSGGGMLAETYSYSIVKCVDQPMIWLSVYGQVVKVINYSLRKDESLLDDFVCEYRDKREYAGHLWAVGKWIDTSGGNGKATYLRRAWRVENASNGFTVEKVPTKLISCRVEAAD